MILHNFHSHYCSMAVVVDYYCYDDERLKLVKNFCKLGVYGRCYLLESSLFSSCLLVIDDGSNNMFIVFAIIYFPTTWLICLYVMYVHFNN